MWQSGAIQLRNLYKVLFLAALVSTPAVAQSNRSASSPWSYSDLEGRWFLDAGLEVENEPTFPGSDDSEIEPFPEFQITWRGARGHQYYLGLGELGAKFRLSSSSAFVLSGGLEDGRDAEEDERLAGLDEIEDGFDLALSYWRRWGPWLAAAQVQTDVGNDKGTVWFLGGGYERDLAEGRYRLRLGVDLSGADAQHLRTELGITSAEAARTDFQEYQPGSGLKTLTLGVELDRWWGRWGLLLSLEAERYLDAAKESPLIQTIGSETTVEASVGFVYRWWR
ncbi:MAG: MipA/OmpV family protein [Acidobacteriota bacterium]